MSEYNEKACCGATHGISIYNDDNNDNIIHIDIDNGKAWDDGFVQYKYEFNTIKNELTKKDSQ